MDARKKNDTELLSIADAILPENWKHPTLGILARSKNRENKFYFYQLMSSLSDSDKPIEFRKQLLIACCQSLFPETYLGAIFMKPTRYPLIRPSYSSSHQESLLRQLESGLSSLGFDLDQPTRNLLKNMSPALKACIRKNHKWGSLFYPFCATTTEIFDAFKTHWLGGPSDYVGASKAGLVDINVRWFDNDLLMAAASAGQQQTVTELLALKGFRHRNACNDQGKTALMMAAEGGHLEVIKLLLPTITSLDLLQFADKRGQTAVLKAEMAGHSDCAQLLQEHHSMLLKKRYHFLTQLFSSSSPTQDEKSSVAQYANALVVSESKAGLKLFDQPLSSTLAPAQQIESASISLNQMS